MVQNGCLHSMSTPCAQYVKPALQIFLLRITLPDEKKGAYFVTFYSVFAHTCTLCVGLFSFIDFLPNVIISTIKLVYQF